MLLFYSLRNLSFTPRQLYLVIANQNNKRTLKGYKFLRVIRQKIYKSLMIPSALKVAIMVLYVYTPGGNDMLLRPACYSSLIYR